LVGCGKIIPQSIVECLGTLFIILYFTASDFGMKYVVSLKVSYAVGEGIFCLLLQVKDQKEFEFNPANIVMDICKIYVHLHESDSFCLAVSQDGRSYSPHLFTYAEDVLGKLCEYLFRISQIQISVSRFFFSVLPNKCHDSDLKWTMTFSR
jgi:hypothetical protein